MKTIENSVPFDTELTWAAFQEKKRIETEKKRKQYVERALQAIRAAHALGVEVCVFGSLTTPFFRDVSDVDFVVLNHDAQSTFKMLERLMGDIPIDVVELDRLKQDFKEKVKKEMYDESRLFAYSKTV